MKLENLFESAGLSSDAQASILEAVESKAAELSESKIAEIQAQLDESEKTVTELKESVETQVAEGVESQVAELSEKVDAFLDGIVVEWAKDNAAALEAGTKVSIAESIFGKLTDILSENNIIFDEQKTSVIEGLESKVAELTGQLDEAKGELVESKIAQHAALRTNVIAEKTKDLTESQVEKVGELLEDVEFSDVEDFGTRVQAVVEKYIAENKEPEQEPEQLSESDEVELEKAKLAESQKSRFLGSVL